MVQYPCTTGEMSQAADTSVHTARPSEMLLLNDEYLAGTGVMLMYQSRRY
jgi:hypothetical protein